MLGNVGATLYAHGTAEPISTEIRLIAGGQPHEFHCFKIGAISLYLSPEQLRDLGSLISAYLQEWDNKGTENETEESPLMVLGRIF